MALLVDSGTEQLSEKYNNACHEMRSLGLSHSAGQKLAKLLLEWSSGNGEVAGQESEVRLDLSHEELAQMIGTSRETVTRVFTEWRKHRIVDYKGARLTIRNRPALKLTAGA